VIVGIGGLILLVLLNADLLHRIIGDIVMEFVTRIFGLILAAIAMQFIVEALGQVFPTWVNWKSAIADNLQQTNGAGN
jgi:multiple antibiotic resistance protein